MNDNMDNLGRKGLLAEATPGNVQTARDRLFPVSFRPFYPNRGTFWLVEDVVILINVELFQRNRWRRSRLDLCGRSRSGNWTASCWAGEVSG